MSPTVNPMDLSGRRILVTGASAGIGRDLCQLLDGLGARLVLNGRDHTRLDDTLGLLSGTDHVLAPFDLTDLDAVPAWMKDLARDDPFDGLAHCAGVDVLRPIRAFDQAFFDWILRANLGSALALARGIRQKDVRAPGGVSVVFLASTAANTHSAGNIVYAAAKAGVISAARSLAVELLGDGIRVNCVEPSIVMTDMTRRNFDKLTDQQVQGLEALQPLGFGQPRDVAHAVAFLLADTGRWITGTSLVVDGGRSA